MSAERPEIDIIRAYDALYTQSNQGLLWGDEPGRIVRQITKYCNSGNILDAGCGDGKNALFLEKQGFNVRGFDYSPLAIEGLFTRFRNAERVPQGQYTVANLDDNSIGGGFDALISYGLFHCLPVERRVYQHIRLQNKVKVGGFIFFTCLTDKLPMPSNHGTIGVVLASHAELRELFTDNKWQIQYTESGTIFEEHLPVISKHQHSAVWTIAKRMSL